MDRRGLVRIAFGLLGAVALAGCITAQVSDTGQDTILVNGYGEARGDPDVATLSVGVNVVDTSIEAAVEESNEAVARVTAALKGMGILEADIQTTSFNVWPEDVYSPETGQITGEKRYHVDSTLQVNVRDVSLTSEVLKVAIQSGANNIYGPNFGIDATDALVAQARAAAIADAQARAEQVAAELGLTLGEVISVKEYSSGPVYAYLSASDHGGGGGGPPLSTGSLTVSMTIEVSFAIVR